MPTSHAALYRAIHAPAIREVVTADTILLEPIEGDGFITVWADGMAYPFANDVAVYRAQFPSAA